MGPAKSMGVYGYLLVYYKLLLTSISFSTYHHLFTSLCEIHDELSYPIPTVKEKTPVYWRFNKKLANGFCKALHILSSLSFKNLDLDLDRFIVVIIIPIPSRYPVSLSCPELACNRPGMQVCDRGNS